MLLMRQLVSAILWSLYATLRRRESKGGRRREKQRRREEEVKVKDEVEEKEEGEEEQEREWEMKSSNRRCVLARICNGGEGGTGDGVSGGR